ncbi:hypothetical protein [Streptomyces sp. PSKA30]|uniref:hypothetical protein n=1 Tax=Streptomyces sp. PSKA30 TaxID=2874597 RepID=UPI001CD0D15B|nr:hypothetical protein [Streptomyces sp. PSKA30]MBZ9639698.1 hypothetical protein [Streptomyces sp. PSKA30]
MVSPEPENHVGGVVLNGIAVCVRDRHRHQPGRSGIEISWLHLAQGSAQVIEATI